jgi:hypothetical protein
MRRISFLLLASFLVGCSQGPMDVDELYYLKVTNGQDNGYIRVKVKAAARLSDAKYRSGWFPAEAVDTVLGNVTEDTTGKTRATRDEMREKLIEALKKAQESFLTIALKPDTTKEEIETALRTWKRVRLVPGFRVPDLEDAMIVEYNPLQGLETLRSDEKLVFVLSANPDTVIRSISQIANDNETKAAIQRFANVMVEGAKAKIDVKKAHADVAAHADLFLAEQIDALAQSIDNGADRGTVVQQAEGVLALLRSLSLGGGQR